MQTRHHLAILALGLLLGAPGAQAARTFCCTDDQSRRICGDVLPDACQKKAYTEFNERGVRVRNVDAPLTEAQQAAHDAELKKKRETERLAVDQKRRDQALLSTYATEAELDSARDRAVKEIERGIKQAEEKLAQAQKTQKKLATDAEFYKGKPLPMELKEQMARNDINVKAQNEAIASKTQQIEQLKAKFEGDRLRLRELHGGNKQADAGG